MKGNRDRLLECNAYEQEVAIAAIRALHEHADFFSGIESAYTISSLRETMERVIAAGIERIETEEEILRAGEEVRE